MTNKLFASWKYRTGFQAKWMLFGLAVYALIMTILFIFLILFKLIHPGEGSLVYRMFFLITTLSSMAMRFKEDFNFLVSFSHSRKNIFLSFALSAAFLSFFTSILIVLERVIISGLNKALNLNNATDPFHFFSPYATENWISMFLFVFSFSLALCAFAILSGGLFYRFGKIFTTFYWIIISLIPTALLPLILWIAYLQGNFSETWGAWTTFLENFNLWSGSGICLLSAALLTFLAYFNIRKMPQK